MFRTDKAMTLTISSTEKYRMKLVSKPSDVQMVALLAASALTDGRWKIDGLSFLHKGVDKSLMVAAVMT